MAGWVHTWAPSKNGAPIEAAGPPLQPGRAPPRLAPPATLGPIAPRVRGVEVTSLAAYMVEVERADDDPPTQVAHHPTRVDQAGPVAAGMTIRGVVVTAHVTLT